MTWCPKCRTSYCEHQPMTKEQSDALDRVLALFDDDPNNICEAMGMHMDGNMGWA